jgi:O-antigen/teichoic acid export membrane protein
VNIKIALTPTRRGAVGIMVGTVLGQVCVLAAAPVLSRLYSPADFGAFAVLSSLVAILGTVLAGRLEQAIGLPVDDGDAAALATVAIVFAALATGVLSVVAVLAADPLAGLLGPRTLAPSLPWVPLIAGLTAAVIVLNQLAARHRKYAAMARRVFLQNALAVVVQALVGLKGFHGGGLLFGLGAGQAGAAVSFTGRLRALPQAVAGQLRGLQPALLRRYRRFPLILAPAGLMNILGTQLTVILFGACYGDRVAGWLGLAQRLIALPVALVGTALGQVYTAELGRALRTDPARAAPLFLRTSRRLALAAAGFGVLVLALAPPLFPAFLGGDWRASGQYAQALAPAMAAQLCVAPVSLTLALLERQPTQFAWDSARVAVVVATVTGSAAAHLSALRAVWLFSAVSAVMYAVMWAASRHALHRHRPPAPVADLTTAHARRTP